MDPTETDDASLIGEICHIVAESEEGPRGASPLTTDDRNKYANLVLLCNVHHKLIDDQPNTFSVDRLRKMKVEHEEWVRSTLRPDTSKQRDHEVYAGMIEHWESAVSLDKWDVWTSWLLGSDPQMSQDRYQQLDALRMWLFNRLWPKRYPDLEASLENFRRVQWTLLEVFNQHAEQVENVFVTQRFYKLERWTQRTYHRLLNDYDFHCMLLGDLVLELTRAANYVCDHIRMHLDPTYRVNEGVLFVVDADILSARFYRPEYQGAERVIIPFPGLEQFYLDRQARDMHFGEGSQPDYSGLERFSDEE